MEKIDKTFAEFEADLIKSFNDVFAPDFKMSSSSEIRHPLILTDLHISLYDRDNIDGHQTTAYVSVRAAAYGDLAYVPGITDKLIETCGSRHDAAERLIGEHHVIEIPYWIKIRAYRSADSNILSGLERINAWLSEYAASHTEWIWD